MYCLVSVQRCTKCRRCCAAGGWSKCNASALRVTVNDTGRQHATVSNRVEALRRRTVFWHVDEMRTVCRDGTQRVREPPPRRLRQGREFVQTWMRNLSAFKAWPIAAL